VQDVWSNSHSSSWRRRSLCPIRREQVVLADAQQCFSGTSLADHCAGVVSADDASFELTLREILEAEVPERQIKIGGHGSRLLTALQAASRPRFFLDGHRWEAAGAE